MPKKHYAVTLVIRRIEGVDVYASSEAIAKKRAIAAWEGNGTECESEMIEEAQVEEVK